MIFRRVEKIWVILILFAFQQVIADYSVEDWIEAALKAKGDKVILDNNHFKNLLKNCPNQGAKRLANLIRNNPESSVVDQCLSVLHELGTLDSEYELINLSKELNIKTMISDSTKIRLLDMVAEKGILSKIYIDSLNKVVLKDKVMMRHLNESLIPGYKEQLERNANLQSKLLKALSEPNAKTHLDEMFFFMKLREIFGSKCVVGMHDKSAFLQGRNELRPSINFKDITVFFCKEKQSSEESTHVFVFGQNEHGIVFSLTQSETHFILKTRNLKSIDKAPKL